MAFSSYILDLIELMNTHLTNFVDNIVGFRNVSEKIESLVKSCDMFHELNQSGQLTK